jgi:hypothetical protein
MKIVARTKGAIGTLLCGTLFLLLGAGVPLAGGELIVYPGKGQSQKQMDKDKYDCYTWAKQQTGFDPMVAPKATAPPPGRGTPEGGLFRGATRGALVGVTAGAIAGDAGKGAAIGAATGGLIGGMRRRDQAWQQEQAQEQWAQKQAAQYTQKRNEYNRAYGACLEGKGYTVK